MAVSLVDLLHRSVARVPARPAVADCAGGSLTYAELDEASAWVASRLHTARGDRVGLLAPKSVEAVVGLWSVMRNGSAYVPLDPAAPPARAAAIARDSGMSAVLVSSELVESTNAIRQAVPDVQVIQIHGEPMHMPVQPPSSARRLTPSPVNARDLAYILYTSGSTGKPKGVMVSHGAALGFVDWGLETFDINDEDVLSNHAPFHFDLSTFDLYCAAAAGASVVVLDEETVRFPMKCADVLERARISVWYSVPGALRQMLRLGRLGERDLAALRVVLFAGEVYPADELHRLQTALPEGVRLCNLYGPTETNVCTWWEVPRHWAHQHPPIGVDCSSCQGVIVDDELQPVPDGVAGELLVRGATLMTGYWGDIARTAQGFVDNFLDPSLGDRFWRTGDIVSRDGDGIYRFHGRRDHMVKVRGYRIELGEIEAALHCVAGIREAAVVTVERRASPAGNELELTAFVVANDDVVGDQTAALRRTLAETLPKYMLPAHIVRVGSLPRTSNGKVDRQGLAQLAASGPTDRGEPGG